MADKAKTPQQYPVDQDTNIAGSNSISDGLFEFLAPLLEGLPENQYDAVKKRLVLEIEEVLFPKNWFAVDSECFTRNVSVNKQSLVSYMRGLNPVKAVNPDTLIPIYGLADFLDQQSDLSNNTQLALFIPDGFYVTNESRLFVLKTYLQMLAVDRELNRLTKFQRLQGEVWLHPDLNGGTSLSSANPHICVLYGWALLLAQAWLNVTPAPRRETLEYLSRCRLQNPIIPPNAIESIVDVLNSQVDAQSRTTCRSLLDDVINSFLHNPLKLDSHQVQDISHEQFLYSVPGKNKKNPANEDRTGVLKADCATLVFVSDGVSTADLGSGEIAAELSASAIRDRESSFAEWALSTKSDKADWCTAGHTLLREIFSEANNSVADKLNHMYARNKKKKACLHPMCATLSAAIVLGNQAVVHVIGDSPVLLYQHATKNLFKLSIEHTIAIERNNVQSTSLTDSSTDEYLTRVIGANWDETANRFVPNAYDAYKILVQLFPGDILIIASDGLLKCVDTYNENIALAKLETVVSKDMAAGADLRKIGQKLVQLADEGQSNDNITVNLLRVKTNREENIQCLKKS